MDWIEGLVRCCLCHYYMHAACVPKPATNSFTSFSATQQQHNQRTVGVCHVCRSGDAFRSPTASWVTSSSSSSSSSRSSSSSVIAPAAVANGKLSGSHTTSSPVVKREAPPSPTTAQAAAALCTITPLLLLGKRRVQPLSSRDLLQREGLVPDREGVENEKDGNKELKRENSSRGRRDSTGTTLPPPALHTFSTSHFASMFEVGDAVLVNKINNSSSGSSGTNSTVVAGTLKRIDGDFGRVHVKVSKRY